MTGREVRAGRVPVGVRAQRYPDLLCDGVDCQVRGGESRRRGQWFGYGGSSADVAERAALRSCVEAVAIERLLGAALQAGGDYAELFFESSSSSSFGFEDGILRRATKSRSSGVGARVIAGDAVGYAYVESFDPVDMQRAAATAAAIAQLGAPKAAAAVPAYASLPDRYPVGRPSMEEPDAPKVGLLARVDSRARAGDARISRVTASLVEGCRDIAVVNSLGTVLFDRQPMVRFGIQVVAESEGQRQTGSSGGGGRVDLSFFQRKPPEEYADEAVRHALVMLDAREAPAGELPVILAPGDSGILLHEAVGHGLEADFNRKRTSNYTDRLGERVASPLCTVVDDATLKSARGSINCDDEGEVPDEQVLIEDGILRSYLHDYRSKRFFGTERGGHGRRESFRTVPMPRMTNTFLRAGTEAPEDMLKGVGRGIYAKKFGGGQVDISNGDFVFSITEGYLIEDGRLTAPVKGVNLIGNGPEAMRRVDRLGHDFTLSDGVWTCGKDGQSVPVGVGCPSVRIASLTVGGTDLA